MRGLLLRSLYAVSRAWLARVANELFGLQVDGRLGLDASDVGWQQSSLCAPIFGPEARIRSSFRKHCANLGLPVAWHAFRRGAASDMLRSGSSVGDILLAGSWRSGAFLRYLRRSEVDARASADSATADGAGVLEAGFDQAGSDG